MRLVAILILSLWTLHIPETLSAQQDTTATYVQDEHDLQKDTDIDRDINNSIPQAGSIVGSFVPEKYSEFKDRFYDNTGIKFGMSYQTTYQKANESLTGNNSAWGGWFLLEFSWVAFNKGKDYQGKLLISLDDRHIIKSSENVAPGFFRLDNGSLWATDAAYFVWDIYPGVLLWEQVFKQDRLEIRVGQFPALSFLDFFRYADPRTSFTNSQFGAQVSMIPIGPPGFGATAKWWPIDGSQLYISGLINDVNATIGEIDWRGIFDTGEIFAGGEIGYNVLRRGLADFDHIHLTFWYGDQVSSKPFPTKSGWGFKLHGSKQWKKLVAFGNYAFNTSEGGGFSYTNTRNSINLGLVYNNPFNIKGETALAGSWGNPIDSEIRNQSGIELYWKVLFGSDIWITPGVQLIWNPSFNPDVGSLSVVHIKSRLFL